MNGIGNALITIGATLAGSLWLAPAGSAATPPSTWSWSGDHSYHVGSVWRLGSTNGVYRAIWQSDGNLVVYHGSTAIWASRTARCASDIIFGGQGLISTYPTSCHQFVNKSSLKTRQTYRLAMQSDGNLVEYTGASRRVAVWATNTVGK
ncbi:MAG: hypothetical protein QOE71_2581 [Pseudonocardiales bacterium]|nr:hypothetical protein [Pseudonocardiales bacterium]MDQ1751525.1 hypothetical protein [Pseudonocardiales bacterium]